MKQILSLTLAAALVAALFTGCGCSANVSKDPGGMITGETTVRPTVMPQPTATHETTRPTETSRPTDATMPTVTGSQPTDGSTDATDGTTGESTTPTDTTVDARHRNSRTVR